MRKILTFSILLNIFISSSTLANADKNLRNRLDKINSFYTKFVQKTINSNGKIIQESRGHLWIRRPSFFHWHVMQPDENIMISDGKTLWFYDPLINQVIITWLKDITRDTPLMLIACNQSNNWKQYNVRQQGDDFILIPKLSKSALEKFTINVNKNGIIHKFNITDQNKYSNNYIFEHQKKNSIDKSMFIFNPPKGAMIDDQRDK